jgi:hypothetical protein
MSETTTEETTHVDDDANSDTGTTPPTETTPNADPADDTGNVRPGNREARYRVERNQAREALAGAHTLIETLQRSEVERLSGDLAQPGDLLAIGGVGLADLLTDEGTVNPQAVSKAVEALIEARPGLAKTPPPVRAVDRSQGQGGNIGRPKPSLGDAFRIK